MLHQHILHFIRDWKKTGAVMPSSKFLARDAVKLVTNRLQKQNRDPVSVLEVGAGTGTFTELIIPYLQDDDTFDVVELNNYFYKMLKHRFSSNEDFRLHHQDFLKYRSEKKYDFVVSSLPYEQIPARITRKMWEKKLSLCKSGSYIIYYKYVNFNYIRSRYEKQLVKNFLFDEKVVLLNMPPARLLTLKIKNPDLILAMNQQKRENLKAVNGYKRM